MFDDRLSKDRRRGRAALTALVIAGVGAALIAGSAFFPTLVEAKKKELRTEVPPGELDDYYGFFSGGHSGEVRVLGLPSMRLFKRIPVFNVDSGSGWGITNESKAMMGGLLVGDTHHCHGSYKDGTYDGKYLWINDKANNRLARIRLDYMETDSIIAIPLMVVHHPFSQNQSV